MSLNNFYEEKKRCENLTSEVTRRKNYTRYVSILTYPLGRFIKVRTKPERQNVGFQGVSQKLKTFDASKASTGGLL